MKSQNLRIEYIFHSGFVVETDTRLCVFDYFQGSVDLKKDKPVCVFSSHAHSDHFNPLIFDWQREMPDIQYILSSDIVPEISMHHANNMTFISPNEEKEIAGMQVKAYNSTDAGVSFLVRSDGVSIFHAGDLNWWYWWDDSAEEIEKAEKGFKEEIAKIKREDIDIAFFPVDPRLEHNYSLGAEFFIREVRPKIFIPMHFGREIQAANLFAVLMKDSPTKIIPLTKMGQEIFLQLPIFPL